jgi:protein-S-isoprenylcysteine O-methyltransferase Ste14
MDLLSVLSRVLPASYFAIVCYGFWRNFLQTGKWTSLLWLVSEGIIVLLLVFRRESRRLSRRPWDWLVALGGTFTVLLVRPATAAVAPESVGVALQLAGTLFEGYGKVYLGRSFGIVAADRGIVVGGPYRIVRHPIYLGYLVTHVGFLLANWSSRNIAIYIVEYFFQVARILSEERLLKDDDGYRVYCERVRYRLIPGVF